jgi:hypothetical protein
MAHLSSRLAASFDSYERKLTWSTYAWAARVSRAERVTENIQAANVTLTGEEVAEIDARSAQVTRPTVDRRTHRGNPAETVNHQGSGRDGHR